MFKRKIITISFILIIIATMFMFTGCKPYDKPELIVIEPSQTAFLIPLIGDIESQASFESEEMLLKAKVSSKEIQIPHRWVKTGRLSSTGKWRASSRIIIVERKPETREWTATKDTGSTAANQAIYAESKESIGFSVGMNCSSQIDEVDAVKFLYRYNNKPLNEIMDTEIRARVESKFVEECSKYSLADILLNKESIMIAVRDDAILYFKERGITINTLGMKDGLNYESKAIQISIDEKFASEQKVISQTNENNRVISEAKAKAEANKIINESINENLINYEKMKAFYEKWDGILPNVMSDGSMIYDVSDKVE